MLYTLQNVKDKYYLELDEDSLLSLDEFIRINYTQVYDKELNFLGYEERI